MSTTLSEILRQTGCSRDDFNNWKRRGYLSAKIKALPGVATQISHGAALEIAFMAALTGVGVKPERASMICENWLKESSLKKYWYTNPRSAAWRSYKHSGFEADVVPALSELDGDPYMDDEVDTEWSDDLTTSMDVPASSLIAIDRHVISSAVERLCSVAKG